VSPGISGSGGSSANRYEVVGVPRAFGMLSFGILTGPAISRYLGTQLEFQLSSVVPQSLHSKLLISHETAMIWVR